MVKKIMAVMVLIRAAGLDNGLESLKDQIPYWTKMLDEEFGSTDYFGEVNFCKELGYRVFRNSEGKHKLVYEK